MSGIVQLTAGFSLFSGGTYGRVIGIVAGFLARLLVPGRDPMGFWATVLLGIIGSFVGGFLAALFTGSKVLDFNAAGLLLSIVGAVISATGTPGP